MSDNYERPTQPYGELAHSESRGDDPKCTMTKPGVVGMPATSIERVLFAEMLSIVRTVGPSSAFDDAQAGYVIRGVAVAIRKQLLAAMDLRADITHAPDFVRRELEG